MDATAVAAAKGFAAPQVRLGDALRVAFLFGGFQAAMPALGWLLGARFAPLIEAWDHWIAFVLLAGIGGKMIHEAVSRRDDISAPPTNPFGWWPLVVLAVATSIDAFAAGVTLPLLGVPLVMAVVVIGAVAAVFSFAGVYVGRRFGDRLGKKLDVFGGVLLIGLGVKTLIEHLSA
jgi:putative Mn2+ efflux pump MntP